MSEVEEYKKWCSEKGLKPSSTKALHDYNEERRTQRIRLFQSKMKLYGDTNYDSLADYLGIVRQTLSKKINGEADFTQTEMSLIKSRYQLTNEEFTQMFIKENCDERTRSSEEIK